MSTPDTLPDIEELLRAALTARAELVQPEDLAPLAPVVELRPRWRSPWVLLATAAVVLLILGVVFQGLDSRPRSDRLAPKPDEPRLELPEDVGRAWERAPMSPPYSIDLDGDGREEKVLFRADRDRPEDGRIRLETTLTSDSSEAYGVVDLGYGGGVSPLEPIDADGDGDRELVLYRTDPDDEMSTQPIVLDLRDGLLVEAPASDPDLLRIGTVDVAGGTEHYDMVLVEDYWIEGEELHSVRSVRSFARLGMELLRPEEYEADAFTWRLDEDGVLRPEASGVPCVRVVPEGRRPCRPGESDALPVLAPVADRTVGIGGSFEPETGGYRFTAALEPASDPDADADLVVTQSPFPPVRTPLRTGAEPLLFTTQPTGLFYDGASVLVASGDGDEPIAHQVLVQDRDRMVPLDPVGDVPLGTGHTDEARPFRTWLTYNGDLVTAVADTGDESGPWDVYSWVRTGRDSMVAAPLDTVCFDDSKDPATARRC